jgi:integrase
MPRAEKPKRRSRGAVDRLPSGAYRVRVYAGVESLTGKRHDLVETVPAGPDAAAEAERVRTRLLNEIDERRNPRTKATVNQLMDRYLDVLDVEESTRKGYVGYINNHIRPVLGELPVAKLDGEVLDSFYGQLRRCRVRCLGKVKVDHRTTAAHECAERCRAHVCRPLAASTVRQVHWILSGALERAVRWRWVGVSPTQLADPPPPPRPDPRPPTTAEAARLLNAAWDDPDWRTLIWLAMTTGARRGELCALDRRDVDLDAAILTVDESVTGRRSNARRKSTKSHQRRRVALDTDTVAILRDHLRRQDDVAAQLAVTIARDAFLFSLDPDCSRPMVPDSVSQRFDRLAARLDIDTSIHKLRHYNATELISAGVDLRTVAGRLGHGGGGTTTLRVYAAWVNEADQRAAGSIAARLPKPPGR